MIRLNPGGIIGAVLVVIAAFVVAVTHPTNNDEAIDYFVKAAVIALIVSSITGTLLWSQFVTPKDKPGDDANSGTEE